MASTFQIFMDGTPADVEFYESLSSVEVEENVDLPGALQLNLPVTRSEDGDLTFVNDDRVKPFANLAVVATPEGGDPQCIFDGFVLSHKLHLQTGTTASTLQVWAQDSSWLMNLEEKAREWANVSDAVVANTIFGEYGFAAAPDNTQDDSPTHTESGHTLMQRTSDIQFLRSLARRNGKLCWVACEGVPGLRVGYFAKPKLDGDPVATLTLNDPEAPTVEALDFEWDVSRPTAVSARQALMNDDTAEGAGADSADSGLTLMDERGLADFAGRQMTVMLTTAVDDGGELSLRGQSLLREAGWFARCEGEVDVSRLGSVLRVGTLVAVSAAGSLNSGNYLVWSVRHTINADAHKMKFVLVRNAVGPPPEGGGGLGGLI